MSRKTHDNTQESSSKRLSIIALSLLALGFLTPLTLWLVWWFGTANSLPCHDSDCALAHYPLVLTLFAERELAESLQHVALAGAALAMLGIGLYSARPLNTSTPQNSITAPLITLGVGILVLFLEDRYDLRHQAWHTVATTVLGMTQHESYTNASSLRSLSDIAIYAAYATLMLWPAWKLRTLLRDSVILRATLVIAYSAYAIASAASASRYILDWYSTTGAWLVSLLPTHMRVDIMNVEHVPWAAHHSPGFWMMDLPLEESIELLGALALCSMCFAILDELQRRKRLEPRAPTLEEPQAPVNSRHGKSSSPHRVA